MTPDTTLIQTTARRREVVSLPPSHSPSSSQSRRRDAAVPFPAFLARSAWLLFALVALFLPTVDAQEATPTPTPTGSPTAAASSGVASADPDPSTIDATNYSRAMFNKTGTPTPGSTAAVGAPTYTFKSDSDVVVAELNKTRPVVVLEFDFDTTSFSFIFNLFRPTSGFKTPRILVSAPSDNGQHYYYPGAAYADRQSGGTTAGGYNVRNENTWEVTWDNGYANWTYGYNPDQTVVPGLSTLRPSILIGLGIDDGIVYQPDQVGEGSISVVALMASNGSTSVDGANELSDLVPLPGDTTSSQVIVFSPVLYNDPIPQPTYPNYTLPDANLQVDPWDIILATHSTNSSNSLESNFPMGRDPVSMLIVQTEVSPIQHGLRNSGWAIVESAESYKNDPSTVIEEPDDTDTIWSTVGGQQGYRQIQVWTGLSPATNYTVWAMSATFTLSQPAFFVTKHADFACSIILPFPMCPGVAYAVPLAMDTVTGFAALPDALSDTLSWSLGNFSTALTANGHACGRDMYSYVSSCLDCYNAYRNWLCHTLLPRCADPNAPEFQDTSGRDAPTRAITVDRTTDTPRNGVNQTNYDIDIDYTEMLPCLTLCTKVERTCPNTLAWTCPHRNFNADQSYAYIGKGTKVNDGSPSTGYPAQDQWGNQWCSGG